MNLTEPIVILSAEGFSANSTLTAHAESKANKLRRHESPRIGHVRIHIRRETPQHAPVVFAVTVTAETRGIDFVAHSSAAEPAAAVNVAFVKLERAVTSAAGVRKHSRHCAPVVEIYPQTAPTD